MRKQVEIADLTAFIHRLCAGSGMKEEDAASFSDVYKRATLRGVGHHDVHELPGRLQQLQLGKLKATPVIKPLSQRGALERYDGDNGLGELCCLFAMRRAEQLADIHGIGVCTVRNSNHFLAAAPYAEQAAEKGYLGLMLSRTKPVMGGAEGGKPVIGNNPFGFAAPSSHGFPISHDIAIAYASFGKLKELEEAGLTMPSHWGHDSLKQPTEDPGEVLNGGTVLPIGGHKGFGIAILIELLTSIIGEGLMIDEQAGDEQTPAGVKGVYTQTAIAIKIDDMLPLDQFRSRVSRFIDFVHATESGLRLPGERSHRQGMEIQEEGLMLDAKLIDNLNGFAASIGVEGLKASELTN